MLSKTRRNTLGVLTLVLFSSTAFAQVELPETVISANLAPIESDKVGASVTVLKGDEMRARGFMTAGEALRFVPGVMVNRNASTGTLTQVRLRGSEANHTLVTVDGVQAQRLDFGDFDWADFLLDDIDRIEVVRGPQSGISGANASSGVIAIFTKSGKGLKRPEAEYRLEGGMQQSHRESASLRGQFGAFYGALTVQNKETKGYNIARSGNENDPNRARSGTVKGGFDVGNLNIEGFVRYVDRAVQYDPEFVIPLADGYGYDKFRSVTSRIAATHTAFDGRLVQRLGISKVDDTFSSEIGFGPFISKANAEFIDYKSTLKYDTLFFGGERHSFTILLDQAKEHYEHNFGANADRLRRGIAAEHVVTFPWDFTFTSAVRQDFNDAFANYLTWRFTAAQNFAQTGTKVHTSVGKSATNPTFVDQFGFFPGFIGNPGLRPESSIGWDFGITQNWWGGKVVTDVTVFGADYTDLIAQIGVSPINLPGVSTRKGIESSLKFTPNEFFLFDATYTYTDAKRPSGQVEIRRPRHVASMNVTAFSADKRGRATFGAAYNGKMQDGDTFNIPGRVSMPAYSVVHAILSYDVTPSTTVYVRTENLFDKTYEENFSYRAPGFLAYAGLKVKLGGK
jgi:vitamin B12 transporter